MCVATDAERRPPNFTADPVLTVIDGRGDLTPPAGRVGTSFELRFSVDEPIDVNLTRVVARIGGQALPFTADELVRGPTDYLYRLTANGSEPEGLARLEVQAIDENGNLAPDPSALSIRLDFSPPSPSLATLTLIPAATNPLLEVQALGSGSTARLLFVMSEALTAPPRVTASPALLQFAARDSGAGPWVFDGTLLEADAGTLDLNLLVEATDLVGNRFQGPLEAEPVLRVDTQAPPPFSDAVYRRIPWGADETQGRPDFRVVIDAGALPDELTVLVTDSADAELGRASVDPQRPTHVLLPSVDRPTVRVKVVDAAGNASRSLPVENVEWVATLGGKRAGDLFANPHRLETVGAFGPSLKRPDAEEREGSKVALADAQPLRLSAQPSWRRRTWDAPDALTFLGLAWDETRSRAVAFGGTQPSTATSGTTLEWSGDAWRRIAPEDPEQDDEPASRSGPAMAFDRRRGVTVLYGGQAVTALDDLWEWDGRSWRKVTTTGGPGLRTRATLVTEPRGVLLIGGGRNTTTPTGEVWRWDGLQWESFDAGLTARLRPAAAWDSRSSRVIIYGGAGGTVPYDTWAFDGASARQLIPDGAGPRVLSSVMVPVPESGPMLFGQTTSDDRLVAFSWTGSTWLGVPLAAAPAFVSNGLAAAWDGTRGRALLELGLADAGHLTLSWSADAGLQTLATGALPAPSRRREAAMAYAPSLGASVLFGGSGPTTGPGPVPLADAWMFDGLHWNRAPGGPTARLSASLTWDETARALVLFGGSADVAGSSPAFNELYSFDGGAWTLIPAAPGPGPTANHAATWAGAGRGLLVHGGSLNPGVSSPLWSWDGAWRSVGSTGPTRLTHVLGYHPDRDLVFQYSGVAQGSASTTSLVFPLGRDGGWQPSEETNVPSRSNASLVFDSDRREALIFGGVQFSTAAAATVMLNDAWAWNGVLDAGARFTPLVPSDPDGDGNPSPRNGHVASFDSRRHTLVLFGGGLTVASGVQYDDTWELDRYRTRPAVLAHFNARAIGWSPQTRLLQVSARAVAGGRGHDVDGGVLPGATLWWWNRGKWEQVAGNLADLAQPGALSGSSTELTIADLATTLEEIGLAVVPAATSGPANAELAVDGLELRLRYQSR